jgi:hypothetical protein
MALTVWQPFASLIVGSPPTEGCPGAPPQKPVENRDKRPWARLLGQQIAIHAGKKMDGEVLEIFDDIFRLKVFGDVGAPYARPKLFPLGSVVGVATLDRAIGPLRESLIYENRLDGIPQSAIDSWALDADGLRWFVSGFGWVLRDRRYIASPVPCRGDRGLWPLLPHVERAVIEQLARAA